MPTRNLTSRGSLTLRVFAKINLSLRILGRIEGGFHSIETLFQNISLSDRLSIRRTDGEVTVTCSDPSIPEGPGNLAYKAAATCLEMLGVHDRGLDIRIEKGIPSGAGLGGGSADAAGTILACERLYGELPGGDSTRYALAASLGADVPFLLSGGRALAWGIGERMLRLTVGEITPVLLALPAFSISTSWAYRALDNATAEGLSTETMDSNGGPLDLKELTGPPRPGSNMVNDFEPVIFAHHPELRELKRRLIEAGARLALLSGSGSGLYGLFADTESRDAAIGKLADIDDLRMIKAEFCERACAFED